MTTTTLSPVREVASAHVHPAAPASGIPGGAASSSHATRLLRVLATDARASALVLRVTLAAVIFPHGAQHLLGWFGGYGFAGTMGWMTGTLGIPAPLAALAIVTEFFGPLALLVGLGGRVAAAGIAGLMIGAALTHLPNGFFMNWFGAQPAGAEGFEYHLLAIAMAAALIVDGSGALSLDRRLAGGQRPKAR